MHLPTSVHRFNRCLKGRLNSYLARPFSTVNEPRKGDRVVVGMSGGVDSSVTALLLSQQDYDLSGIFMRNWDTRDESGTDKGCEWEKDWEDVQRVCTKLDIPCQMIDLSQEYWNRVFEPSLRQWERGATPNPDVWCNKEIKFGALLDRLPIHTQSPQNSWIATGHYARKSWSKPTADDPPRPQLRRPADPYKDQTYYLSSISEFGLRRALFPIGHLTKPEVREIAKKYKLATAERPDSVGICFVGEKTRFNNFLSSYFVPNPGPIVNQVTGHPIGRHTGLWNFTVGQNVRLQGQPQKMFVSNKNSGLNTIYVVPGSNHEALYTSTIHVSNFNWIWRDAPPPFDSIEGFCAYSMHRYRMKPVPCRVYRSRDSELVIKHDEPLHAVTPGQVVALFDKDWCLGCGVIKES